MRNNLVVLTLALATFCGCGGNTPSPAKKNTEPEKKAEKKTEKMAVTIDANLATKVWDKLEVETFVKEDIKLVEVTLKETTKNNYSGTGKDAQGRIFNLQVKQVPGGIACDFTNNGGGSGRVSFGNSVP
ncbi:MAG: hypothetical protein EXR99_09625 [Gemmataceae bacterium]|nr:hypothetical protein [Gemmataceae bacterium]